ncbi:MAG TPA: hypothetical protein VK601_24410, partial [Kofleriaceae bacterium]|nr:hypothetical protein [Kofleriaceae bacterium]
HERSDFGLDDCVRFVNDRWSGALLPAIEQRVRSAQGCAPGDAPAPLLAALRAGLDRQQATLEFAAFDLREVVDSIFDWTAQLAQDPQHGHWQLKGLALLAYPILPALSCRLWSWLGGEGEPTIERFGQAARPSGALALDRLAPISRSTLTPCLPATLER